MIGAARAPLPIRFFGPGSLAVGATGLAVAVGVLPLPLAGIVAVGVPTVLLGAVVPRITLTLLLFSIPFSSFAKVSTGSFDVTSTDALVGLLCASWIARAMLRRELTIVGGPTIVAAIALLGAEVLASVTAISFPLAIKEMIKLAELIAVALYAATNLRRAGDLRFIMRASFAAGVAEAMVGLFQFVTGRGPATFAIGPFIRAYGDFSQPNAFAGYIALILPFAVAWMLLPGRGRLAAGLVAGILGMAMLASLSRGAWLGTGMGLAAMALLWTRHAKRVIATGAIMIALLFPAARAGLVPTSIVDRLTVVLENYWIFDVTQVEPDPSNWAIVERMAHWQAGWAMAMDHFITGVGPGNYEAAYPYYFLPTWVEPLGHAHNLYLNMFAETGIIGLIAFSTFTVLIFIRIIQALRRNRALRSATQSPAIRSDLLVRRVVLIGAMGAAVTFSVHNTFDNMFIHGMGVQFGLVLGLIEAQMAGDTAPRTSTSNNRDGNILDGSA